MALRMATRTAWARRSLGTVHLRRGTAAPSIVVAAAGVRHGRMLTTVPPLENVLVDIDGTIAVVTVNRPKALNALNAELIADLGKAFEALKPAAESSDIRCVILTGAGPKAFVAGADIKGMTAMGPTEAENYAASTHAVFAQIESFPTPVLAAVNGFALGGGCELASSCDVIYAAATAKFGQPEVTLGLIPGFAGTVRLPRRIGTAAAMEWTCTGNLYTASQAKEAGLVQEVLPPSELLPHVHKIAATISKRAPIAVREAKRLMVDGTSLEPAAAALAEQRAFGRLFDTRDAQEGCTAFVEKRKASWMGQ